MSKLDFTPLRIWLQIAKLSAHMEQEVNGKLKENYGQSLSRFDVLSQFIRIQSDEISVGALSKNLIASSGNISRLLDRMEKDGLITRKHSDTDRRAVYVAITQNGSDLFDAMAEDHAKWVTHMLKDLPPKRQALLSDLLKEMQSILGKEP